MKQRFHLGDVLSTSAIAKLIAEARERAKEGPLHQFKCIRDADDCDYIIRASIDMTALADTLEAVTKERDALRERMDVALSALHEYAIRERDAGEVGDSVASDALAEIAALASRATPQEPKDAKD